MRKYNFVVAALSILMGCGILWFSRNLTPFDEMGIPGEAFWPQAIAWLLIFLGGLQAVQSLVASPSNGEASVDLHSPGVRAAYIGAVLAFGYAGLMAYFGFSVATLVFIPLLMLLMGERKPLMIAVTALAVVAVVWFFFVQVFNTTLPPSIFLD